MRGNALVRQVSTGTEKAEKDPHTETRNWGNPRGSCLPGALVRVLRADIDTGALTQA